MKLRFSIRDLLWLTALVALAMGWWLDHARTNDERELWRLSLAKEQALEEWRQAHKKADEFIQRVPAFSGEFDFEARPRERYFDYRAQLTELLDARKVDRPNGRNRNE